LPFEWDATWWLNVRDVNIQIDMAELVGYRQTHRAEIDGFKLACFAELRRMVRDGYRREAA
jgi:hypothetical protein